MQTHPTPRFSLLVGMSLVAIAGLSACHRPEPPPSSLVRNDTRFELCEVNLDGVAAFEGAIAPGQTRPTRHPGVASTMKAKPCDGGRELCATAGRFARPAAELYVFDEASCRRPEREALVPLNLRNKTDETLCSVQLQIGDGPNVGFVTLLDRKQRTSRLDPWRQGIVTIDASELPRVRGVIVSSCDEARADCVFPAKLSTLPPSITFDRDVCPSLMHSTERSSQR